MRFLHICLKGGNFAQNTPIYNITKFLAKEGHKNIVITRAKVKEDWVEYIKVEKINNFFMNIIEASKNLISQKYDCIFVYEPADAYSSSILIKIIKKLKKILVIYYNIEIYTVDFKGIKRKIAKKLEQNFLNYTDIFVIQDELRLKIMRKEFKLPEKIFLIPNSFDFSPIIRKIPTNPPRVLYSGGVERYIFDEIFEEIEKIDINFEFVIQGTSKYGFPPKKLKNIKFIEKYIEPQEYEKFISNFDVGFVWYDTKSLNNRFVGLSSGKYFRFLSLGKPVIVRNLPILSETTIKNGFGETIDKMSEIGNAVERITKNYEKYVDSIIKNYEKFSFSKNFQKLYREIMK